MRKTQRSRINPLLGRQPIYVADEIAPEIWPKNFFRAKDNLFNITSCFLLFVNTLILISTLDVRKLYL